MFFKRKHYNSPVNGNLYYTKDFTGTWSIKLDPRSGYSHSGSYLEKMWKNILAYYKEDQISRILILGSGAGCSTHVAHTLWPKATIDAVDYDPILGTDLSSGFRFEPGKLSAKMRCLG